MTTKKTIGICLVALSTTLAGCADGSPVAGATAAHRESDDPLPVLTCTPVTPLGAPTILGSPALDSPRLLDWPSDVPRALPDLTEPTSNRLEDLHGEMLDCSNMDLVFSTAGNYHMALRELWRDVLLPGSPIENWFYTTSPPIGPQHVEASSVTFGNLALGCTPMVAAGPGNVMAAITAAGYADGRAVPIVRNRGNVILVKKGNPRHIHSVWDLGRRNVRVVTPNPCGEAGSFDNFAGTIYNVAANDPSPPDGMTADELFSSIFDSEPGDRRTKWLTGARIMHREIPWSIAHGEGDAAVIFYHLALYAVRTFPDLFEIVPLGGTVDDPMPLPGNRVGVISAIRINGGWSDEQLANRERLMTSFSSPEFREILSRHGLEAP